MKKEELIDKLVKEYHYCRAGLLECSNLQLKKIACRERITNILKF